MLHVEKPHQSGVSINRSKKNLEGTGPYEADNPAVEGLRLVHSPHFEGI